jgi:hypothetical protein
MHPPCHAVTHPATLCSLACHPMCSSQVETNASRVREQQTRISQLEIQMRNQAQLEEEIKMYKEQARSLAEQSVLAGGEGAPGRRATTPGGAGTPRATTPRATSTPGRGRDPAADAAASPAPVPEGGGAGLFGGLGAKMQAAQAAASKRASGLMTQGASLVNEYAAQPPAAAPDQ